MSTPGPKGQQVRSRNLAFLSEPKRWPFWPFLPLVRRWPGGQEECGLLYDARGRSGQMGYSATVFLCNLFELPDTEKKLLALSREVYDSPEEIFEADWRVD